MKYIMMLVMLLVSYSSFSAERCAGTAQRCEGFEEHLCGSQKGCYYDLFQDKCTGEAKRCSSFSVGSCRDQDGCYVETIPDPEPVELGGVDLNSVCRDQMNNNSAYVVLTSSRFATYAAYGWKCKIGSSSTLYGIDMQEACDFSYPGQNAYAEALDLNDAYSWKCFK